MTNPLSPELRTALARVPDEWTRCLAVGPRDTFALLEAGFLQTRDVGLNAPFYQVRRTPLGRSALESDDG